MPHHAGWGRSPRADWMRSVRDMAVMHRGLLAELGIEKAALVGLGFGGWIAAEMATMAPRDVRQARSRRPDGHQAARGRYPRPGHRQLHRLRARRLPRSKSVRRDLRRRASTDQLEDWDITREMCFRIAWKPYMYSQTLPHLLGGVKAPALVVWGDEDRIVPLECGERYCQALPQRQARGHRELRPFRGYGAAGAARQARHALHRR